MRDVGGNPGREDSYRMYDSGHAISEHSLRFKISGSILQDVMRKVTRRWSWYFELFYDCHRKKNSRNPLVEAWMQETFHKNWERDSIRHTSAEIAFCYRLRFNPMINDVVSYKLGTLISLKKCLQQLHNEVIMQTFIRKENMKLLL